MVDEAKLEQWIGSLPRITAPKKYVSTLKTISKDLLNKGLGSFNLFVLTKSEDAILLKEKYFSYADLYTKNKRGNRMYSRAFDLLIQYLEIQNKKPLIIIQPIGNDKNKNLFFIENSNRWAEKLKYKKAWEQSLNATVLFVVRGHFFAKAVITKIDQHDNGNYPLNYYYDCLIPIHNIDYQKIIQLANHPLHVFKNYTLIDAAHSQNIFHYLDSVDIYLDDSLVDEITQDNLDQIDSSSPKDEKPQPVKNYLMQNGRRIYPRNLQYAKKALENAQYQCEINKSHKTFISKASKQQFVEAHHLIPIKAQTQFTCDIDIPINIVALCPTCHKKLHFASIQDKEKMLQLLLNAKQDKLKIFGIDMNIIKLKSFY